MSGRTWQPLEDPVAQATLAAELCRWEGTPYLPGSCAPGPGGGVDCVRFVVAVWNALARVDVRPDAISPAAAVHHPERARMAFAELAARFPCAPVPPDAPLEPGDVIATGPIGGGPGHGVIVGDERRICWDATYPAVRRISLGLVALVGHEVHGAWRLMDRRWTP